MKVNFNKIEQISTVDYPGKSACVVFLNGCPWRCPYCHNKQTWYAVNMVDIEDIKEQIKACLPFVNAIVFSGGEPMIQVNKVIELSKYSKSLGLSVSVETNGFYTECIYMANGYVDVWFIDVKYPLRKTDNVYQSLCLEINREVRIVDKSPTLTKSIIKTLPKDIKTTTLPYIKRK